MDLKGQEMVAGTGQPIVAATVDLIAASDTQPNPTAVSVSTTTDTNGIWAFTGVVDADYDVRVTTGAGKIKWYKGLLKQALYQFRTVLFDLRRQASAPANPDSNAIRIYPLTATGKYNDGALRVRTSAGVDKEVHMGGCYGEWGLSKSIAGAGAFASVDLATEALDTDGMATPVAAQATIVTAGRYRITAVVTFPAGGGTVRGVRIAAGGVNRGQVYHNANVASSSLSTTVTVNLAVGNTVAVEVSQDSGGATTVTGTLFIDRVSPT